MSPRWLVVMGVSGCGKSTLGAALARTLGVEFVEGDEFHPPRNVARMAAGIALTDDDRREWLDALAARIAAAVRSGQGLVLACSALRRSYRDRLRAAAPDLGFVHLQGDHDTIAARMTARPHHYMPASLLASQFATLEAPGPDENAITLDAGAATSSQLEATLKWLHSPK